MGRRPWWLLILWLASCGPEQAESGTDGPPDAGDGAATPADRGVPDWDAPDAAADRGVPDEGLPDAAPPDRGVPDADPPDVGPPDAAALDGGDAEPLDMGIPDMSAADAEAPLCLEGELRACDDPACPGGVRACTGGALGDCVGPAETCNGA